MRIRSLTGRLDIPALGSFFLPFILYLLTMAPSIYNLDSAELTTGAATGGILRATGYPLYLVIGRLWAMLPVGDVGYRMNLFSAVCGAVTIYLADRILRRLDVGIWARFGALGLLATAQFFWALSLIAEVYTLHTALMAAIILALMRWDESPCLRRFVLPIFLLGLSLGNHAATVLLIPGVLFYILISRPQQLLQPRAVLGSAVAFVLGASIYLYLPWRYGASPIFNYAGTYNASGTFDPVNLRSIDGLIWLVTGKTFTGQMFAYSLSELLPEILNFGHELLVAFFAVGVLPGFLGLVYLIRNRGRIAWALTLFFLANAIFYVNYRVIDKTTMYLPLYLVWAIWLGYGYQQLLGWLDRLNTRTLVLWLARGILVFGVLGAAIWNWSIVDLSEDWSTRVQSERILHTVKPNAIIFGWWETVPALQYLQLVEGFRPDVTAINRFLIKPEDMNRLILSQVGKRPIYINNPSVELLKVTRVTPAGALYRVDDK